jgi:hypothetical protein
VTLGVLVIPLWVLVIPLWVLVIPLLGLIQLPYPLLLVFDFLSGLLLFTLYPLAVALANDNIEQARREP